MDDDAYEAALKKLFAVSQSQIETWTMAATVFKKAIDEHAELQELRTQESARYEDTRYQLLTSNAAHLTEIERERLQKEDEDLARQRHEESQKNSFGTPRGNWTYKSGLDA